jgi:hypothetical protein
LKIVVCGIHLWNFFVNFWKMCYSTFEKQKIWEMVPNIKKKKKKKNSRISYLCGHPQPVIFQGSYVTQLVLLVAVQPSISGLVSQVATLFIVGLAINSLFNLIFYFSRSNKSTFMLEKISTDLSYHSYKNVCMCFFF